MLKALVRALRTGKIQMNEDLLTSAVFGTLANLDPRATIAVFKEATPLRRGLRLELKAGLRWEWCFWPWWGPSASGDDRCQPDVVIIDPNTCNLVVIEAKLRSPFGSALDNKDQLDREWRRGRELADSKHLANCWLITVTDHITMPRDEILKQLKAVPDCDLSRVASLSWTDIARILEGLAVDKSDPSLHEWIGDLQSLFKELGLGPFEGFSDIVAKAGALSFGDFSWLKERWPRMNESGKDLGPHERSLVSLLELHKDFVEQCYSLLRYFEGALDREGYKPIVWWEARDATGSAGGPGGGDVPQTFLGKAFVRKSEGTEIRKSEGTEIPEGGLHAVLFEIRWLRSDDGPPVARIADIRAQLDPHRTTLTLDKFYQDLYRNLNTSLETGGRGDPLRFEVKTSGMPLLRVSGTCKEIPLSALSSQNVDPMLLQPALEFLKSEGPAGLEDL